MRQSRLRTLLKKKVSVKEQGHLRKVGHFSLLIPISFPPWERQRDSEQASAKLRIRGSSERVCMRMFMLTILSKVSSVMASSNAPKHSCSNGFPSVKFNLIQTSIWPVKTVDTCRSLSSRQNANFLFHFISIKDVDKLKKEPKNTYHHHPSSRLWCTSV